MVIESMALAIANLMVALLGLAAIAAQDGARIRSVTGRAVSSKPHGPKVIWVIDEVGAPSALLTSRRSGRST